MEDIIGKNIDNYKILSLLGRGGMGVVYKAFDEKLDRHVAIKVLNVQGKEKERLIERFKTEAKNQAKFVHPNIVTVYGFIENDDMFGIVMEYVDGESLEKVLHRQKRLHVYDVVYIMRQALKGIGYAHSKGFVHRDIKPSNIIMNSEGIVKIMDFGISKSLFEKGVTVTGSKVGTSLYMSPEQIKGNDVDYRADIYSIGCTLYEMISGDVPFSAETEYDVMDGHLKKPHKKLFGFVPGIPEVLSKVVDRCLMKKPEERFFSCNEILDEFKKLDDYLKEVHSKYFVRKKPDPKKSKIYSIVTFTVILTTLFFLTRFVYYQVHELLDSGQLNKLKKYNIQTMFSSEVLPEFKGMVKLNSGVSTSLNFIKSFEKGIMYSGERPASLFSLLTVGKHGEKKRLISKEI